MTVASADEPVRTIGRYALFDEIAAGGMATVHLGRLLGPVGFSRTVAIKRLHSHFAKDPEFSAGFVDEARLAARIHHPNVVPIIDVLAADGELSLVMDYVEGDSFAKLLRHTVLLNEPIPLPIVSAIVCGSLYGLHAAHEAGDESGEPMHIVHRDVSPQNILVGCDGIPRIVDFGVAKAAQRLQTTAEGQVKGKIAYMAPEQIRQAMVSRQTDVYAMGVVLWEALTGTRLFQSENHANLMTKVLHGAEAPPSALRPSCSKELDAIVMKALAQDPSRRHATARQMATELQKCLPPAPQSDVGDWVNAMARDALTDRRRVLKRVESREVPAEGENTASFVSRGTSDDLATVIERHGRTIEEGSTQAVTGTVTARKDASRLVLPLILGLGVVVGGIWALLINNEPRFDTARTPASPSVETLEAAKPSPSEAGSVILEPSSAAPPPVKTGGDDSAENKTPEDGQDATVDPQNETTAVKPAENTERPPVQQRPAAVKPVCPKYVTDADGIQRINRKCWK